MKNKVLLFLFVFITCANMYNTAKAQVNEKDSLALVDFYKFTNGKNWYFNNGWLTPDPLYTWEGVTVQNNRVVQLLLSFNNLRGILPPSIGDLTALRTLGLGFNNITGRIPATIGNMEMLEDLEIHYNKLIGTIPASITQLTNLESIYLAHNQLSGSIPEAIDNLTKLDYINISYNNLAGNIPASFGDIFDLNEMNFTHNQLTGSIPSSLGNLTAMWFLDLSHNQLTGKIPSSLGNLTKLFNLYLNNNQLTGDVPRLYALFDINLSHNDLSQSRNIPVVGDTYFTGLDLRYNSFNFNGLEFAERKVPNSKYRFQEQLSVHVYNNKLAVSAGGTLSNNTYNWYRVGNAQPTVVKGDSTFVPGESGQYYATITNSIAKQLTLSTDTVAYTATSKEAPITLAVYPNPVKNTLTINGLDLKHNYRVLVTDVTGYVWLNTAVKNQSLAKLNVTSLRPGNYLVNVNDGVQTKTLQFIKQ